MNFDKFQPNLYWDHLKQLQGFPQNFIAPIFLIGKLTQDNTIVEEIKEILKNNFSVQTLKAFNSRSKIPVTGERNDIEKTVSALLSFGKIDPHLPLGEIFNLLEFDNLYFSNSSTLKKLANNIQCLKQFNGVKKFCIYKDTFSCIPEELGELISLEELQILGDYDSLPSSLGKLVHLKKLELSMPKLKELPQSISDLESLNVLMVNSNVLEEIPEGIKNIPYLETLELGADMWTRGLNENLGIEPWFSELLVLKKLELNKVVIDEITEHSLPPNLEVLRLSSIKNLSQLPESIGSLKHLKELELVRCTNLKELPDSIGELKSLVQLDISGIPQLITLPETMGKLSNLEEFNLGGCDNFTHLPESMVSLSLKMLRLKRLPALKEIDGTITFSPLMEILYIEDGHITITPPDKKVFHGTSLTISNNAYYTHLIKNTDCFPSLEHLVLKNINCNTPGIENLKNLRSLSIEKVTGLESFLSTISLCEDLKEIKIKSCSGTVNTDLFPKQLHLLEIDNVDLVEIGDEVIQLNSFVCSRSDILNFDKIDRLQTKKIAFHILSKNTVDNEGYIQSFPESLRNIKELTSFKFRGSVHTVNHIDALQNLTELHLEGHGLFIYDGDLTYPIREIVPFQLPNLKSLSLLNFMGDNLEEILKGLPNLEELKLRSLTEKVFPKGNYPSLKTLDIHECDFETIHAVEAPNIKTLKVAHCDCFNNSSFDQISQWSTLENLSLRFLKCITTLPESLANLPLKSLSIAYLNIGEVPDFIGDYKDLVLLSIESMNIETLPNDIAQLPKLEYLSLSGTKLETLSDEFRSLKLKELKMYRSKFSGNNMKEKIYAKLLSPNYTKIMDLQFSIE
ncbi:leucine-rich repeat domain-containing protein [Flammeovirga aprica]|uniref:Disease resistance R13L4/SHOC-2-like LRR domain-containing protein n=1 Tax=Flammeovirga aprica JL-4 TaxID=694437 RepID=A0A7X9P2W8_9BACT|nr:hypothetical protein [Flammeovirga aprica]NME68188.1 hypothetical protein [Flammeovirga aprica JL-4]